MNSYQNIGMYLYHTCCHSTRIFFEEYYCIDHAFHTESYIISIYLTNLSGIDFPILLILIIWMSPS